MDDRIIKIADNYGKHEETLKCMEELDELKWALIRRDDKNAVEEIADVFITLCEQVYQRDCAEEVKKIVNEKLNRQLQRMEEEKNDKTENQ